MKFSCLTLLTQYSNTIVVLIIGFLCPSCSGTDVAQQIFQAFLNGRTKATVRPPFEELIAHGQVFYKNESLFEPIIIDGNLKYVDEVYGLAISPSEMFKKNIIKWLYEGDVLKRVHLHEANSLRLKLECTSEAVACVNQKLPADTYLASVSSRKSNLFAANGAWLIVPFQIYVEAQDEVGDFEWVLLKPEEADEAFFIVRRDGAITQSFVQTIDTISRETIVDGLTVTEKPTCSASIPASCCQQYVLKHGSGLLTIRLRKRKHFKYEARCQLLLSLKDSQETERVVVVSLALSDGSENTTTLSVQAISEITETFPTILSTRRRLTIATQRPHILTYT